MTLRRRKKGNLVSCSSCKGSVSLATRRHGLPPSESSTRPPAVHPQKRPEEREDERREGDREANSPRPGEESEEEEGGEQCEEEDRRQEIRKVVVEACSNTSAAHSTLPSPDTPVCAKNVSLTSTGQRVILWTREADRVILTTCQQKGANRRTFQAVSARLGNKTAGEVSLRFRELMELFRSTARPDPEAGGAERLSGSEDEPD